jgi:hypothetical protein
MLRIAAGHAAKLAGATAVLAFHVRAQALPIEAPLEQQEPSGGGKRDKRRVQVLLVIELGLANEALVLGVLAGFGSVQQL